MLCILSNSLNPYFNLAAEEYLLKSTHEEVFMLWRCNSTIVVGKHQNALAEINYPYVMKNNIMVARRLTGGGTVFHDIGNINFTFIREGEKGKLVDFKKFISPIIEVLRDLGVGAEQGLKNEILLNGKKISGNAEHIYKSRVLHHGTLLYNSELDKLNEALKVTHGKYQDKSVQSNRSQVTNIQGYLNKKMSVEEFTLSLFVAFKKKTTGFVHYEFSKPELHAIETLMNEKYSTWEWIYGYSPKYRFQNSALFGDKRIGVILNVEGGIIKSAEISGNFLEINQATRFAQALFNQKHNEQQIKGLIQSFFHKDLAVSESDNLLNVFF